MNRQLARVGKAVNKIERPILGAGLELYYDAFFALSPSRPVGMGRGAIPWIAIREYAVYNEFDEFQVYMLHLTIAALDTVYLEWWSAYDKRNRKS